MTTLSIIVAMTDGRVIGRNNQLPWHLSEDLKRFKQITIGKPVIMGRKTYESMGRLLPSRQNIIISHNPSYTVEGGLTARSLEEAIMAAQKNCGQGGEFFVIGGSEIFTLALPKAKRFYLTLIHKKFEGDVYFPEFDLERDFKVIEKSDHTSLDSPPFSYSFITAERVA